MQQLLLGLELAMTIGQTLKIIHNIIMKPPKRKKKSQRCPDSCPFLNMVGEKHAA